MQTLAPGPWTRPLSLLCRRRILRQFKAPAARGYSRKSESSATGFPHPLMRRIGGLRRGWNPRNKYTQSLAIARVRIRSHSHVFAIRTRSHSHVLVFARIRTDSFSLAFARIRTRSKSHVFAIAHTRTGLPGVQRPSRPRYGMVKSASSSRPRLPASVDPRRSRRSLGAGRPEGSFSTA